MKLLPSVDLKNTVDVDNTKISNFKSILNSNVSFGYDFPALHLANFIFTGLVLIAILVVYRKLGKVILAVVVQVSKLTSDSKDGELAIEKRSAGRAHRPHHPHHGTDS